MSETSKRVFGYGLGAAAVGALVYSGFFHETDADFMTLISSARTQFQLAASMPPTGKDGQPSAFRTDLLDEAEVQIRKAQRQHGKDILVFESFAMLAYLRGDYMASASWWAKGLDAENVTPEVRQTIILNQARMLRFAHRTEQAVALLEAKEDSFSGENRALSQVEKMLCLDVAGRPQDAVQVAKELGEKSEEPKALMEAAHYLVRSKQLAEADAVFARAASADPTANYYRARLKIRARQIDTGLDLLETALKEDPRRVRSMLSRDRESWQACAEHERFQKLTSPVNSAATPGR